MDALLSKLINYFLIASLLIASFVIFLNVILRYFFNSGVVGSEELVRYLIIWNIFIGGSSLVLSGEHLSMDAFIKQCPEKIKVVMNLMIYLIGIVFSFALVVYSAGVIEKLTMSNTPALQIPSYIPYLAIPIGSLLTALRYMHRFYLDGRLLVRGEV
ncbi:TRAP transporter small permease [Ammoniphilus sp. YIM 78166]|uniref:TRAP transporter small permease n=1 Tax=Ammoniphilus sp. YIM 78166 TaxID=1644106 RepID=UPI001F0D5D31|nr:TRAP transporter small permease [Ammoniphilus sp. YIM 78166]